MPNTFAYAMLFAWPIVTAILFTRLQARDAVVWSLLGGMLLLPENTAIDLPGVPPFNKLSIASLAVLCCALMLGRERPTLIPRGAVGRALVLMLIAGPFVTALLNGDRLSYGPNVLPGMSTYDALAAVAQAVFMVIPFLLARHYLATPEAHRTLLWAVLAAGLAYSLPILFEVRMSPQLHNIVYGFFPHSWGQQYRFGGFRPVVFMQHGLWLAMFVALVTVAAAALWRMAPPGQPQRRKLGLALVFFLVIALLCRTVSVWALLLVAVPLVVMASPRVQLRIAALLIGIVLLYPVLRGADLVPTETLISAGGAVSAERAESLQFRFDNEDRLLEKADRRPIFGWGSWGRNRVYHDVKELVLTVTDGYWVIVLGVGGWFR